MNSKIKYGVACVVMNPKGQIILLKRSSDKKYFPNKWLFVSAGPLSAKNDKKQIALREIKDELGVDGKIIRVGKVYEVFLEGENWRIATFLGKVKTSQVKLNKEHTESRWILPGELDNFDTPLIAKEIADSFFNPN